MGTNTFSNNILKGKQKKEKHLNYDVLIIVNPNLPT